MIKKLVILSLFISSMVFAKDVQRWGLVSRDVKTDTYRMWVPGGWLIKIECYNNSSSITFYPDPNHVWNIK